VVHNINTNKTMIEGEKRERKGKVKERKKKKQ
jgi:hypothetical protein